MPSDSPWSSALLNCGLALVLGGLLAWWLLANRRKVKAAAQDFTGLARQLGWQGPVTRNGGVSIEGAWNGRRASVWTGTVSPGSGNPAYVMTTIEVALARPLPEGIEIKGKDFADRAFDGQLVPTGDPAFDERFAARGPVPALQQVLQPDTRAALLRLVGVLGHASLMRGGDAAIRAGLDGSVDATRIRALLEALDSVAQTLG